MDPITRKEKFLAKAGGQSVKTPEPITREEMFLQRIAENGSGGGGGGSASIDVTASVGQTIVVEEVDANGKPTKWESADYQPRTHWGEEGQEDIVPKLTFTPVLDESMGVYQHPLAPFELVEGKTYTVIFDGLEYSCTAKHTTLDNLEGIFIGNGVLVGENTGEPFAIMVGGMKWSPNSTTAPIFLNKMYMVISFDSNEHTVKVSEDKIVPHKIPDEYVAPSFFYVRVGLKGTSDFVLLTPWEHIIEAVMSRKTIYLNNAVEDFEFDQHGVPTTYFHTGWKLCTDAKVSTNSLRCNLVFMNTGNSDGTVNYLTVARDENGVTTISP